jgi:uncharacterized protein YdeI (YjbR/CyaY-like superfamily)
MYTTWMYGLPVKIKWNTDMETYNGIPAFYATDRAAWRQWLEKNHQSEKSVWLIIYKKESGIFSVYYPEAVDEALCFGWIDSIAIKRDAESRYQYFARRNPKSNWSRVNKAKVAQLKEQGLMTESGLRLIEMAQQNGSWTALDDVENLRLPDDLQALFDRNELAFQNW